MSTNLSSNTLFHYTKKFETLKKILKEGFKPSYSLEDFEILLGDESKDLNKYFIPMISFCDIPLSSTKNHISKYGCYAIGLSRKWAESNGLNPVMYISHNSQFISNFSTVFLNYQTITKDIQKEKSDLLESIKNLNFIDINKSIKLSEKDFNSFKEDLIIKCRSEDFLLGYSHSLNEIYEEIIFSKDSNHARNRKLIQLANLAVKSILYIKPFINKKSKYKYYDEKEWRYIPDNVIQLEKYNSWVIEKSEHFDAKYYYTRQKKGLNSFIHFNIMFQPKDIRYILVNKKMKGKLIDFLMKSSKYREDYLLNNFIVLTESQIKEDM